MTKGIKAILGEWEFARMCTKDFLQSLNDENLKKKLIRPELDTFIKHFEEMINVQEAYVNAIKNGKMTFNTMLGNDEFVGKKTREQLIKEMDQLDEELKKAVENIQDDFEVEWEGESKTIASHICALCTHELFHIGQLVAFCYVEGIKIPGDIMESWALSKQD